MSSERNITRSPLLWDVFHNKKSPRQSTCLSINASQQETNTRSQRSSWCCWLPPAFPTTGQWTATRKTKRVGTRRWKKKKTKRIGEQIKCVGEKKRWRKQPPPNFRTDLIKRQMFANNFLPPKTSPPKLAPEIPPLAGPLKCWDLITRIYTLALRWVSRFGPQNHKNVQTTPGNAQKNEQ